MMRELTWELACGKPPLDGMKLDQVMAFYHNDQEEGFGVGLGQPADADYLEKDLHNAFNAYKEAWDKASEQSRKEILCHYLRQVEDAAREGRGNRSYPEIILIMNVIWLVHYAGMPEDEYNGLQFVWANEPARNVLWAAQ